MIKRNMLLASAMFCTIAAFAGTEMSVFQGSDVSVRVVYEVVSDGNKGRIVQGGCACP